MDVVTVNKAEAIKMTETREEVEARWRSQHQWDGPPTVIGWVEVPTCSKCGCNASEQRPCIKEICDNEQNTEGQSKTA